MSFVSNPAFERELLLQPEAVLFMDGVAERKAEKARDIAPVGDPNEDPHPGRFRDSIHHDAGIEKGRAIGRVYSTDPDFIYIEFATEHSPPHATLRRCIEGA